MHADIKMEGLQSCSRDAHFLSWSVCCIEKEVGGGWGRGHGIGSPGDIAITSVCWGDGSDAGAPWSVYMAICFTSKRGSSSLPPIRCFWWVVDPLQGGGEQRSASLLGAHHSAADGCTSLQFFCCCFGFFFNALCKLLKCYRYSMHKVLIIALSADRTACALRPPGSVCAIIDVFLFDVPIYIYLYIERERDVRLEELIILSTCHIL